MVKRYRVSVNGKSYEVDVEELSQENGKFVFEAPGNKSLEIRPDETSAQIKKESILKSEKSDTLKPEVSGSVTEVTAPMSGLIVEVFATVGQNVKPGEKLLVLEAMKMENDILSDCTGIVKDVKIKKGENAETGQILLEIIK